jgi:hypothetical protein
MPLISGKKGLKQEYLPAGYDFGRRIEIRNSLPEINPARAACGSFPEQTGFALVEKGG